MSPGRMENAMIVPDQERRRRSLNVVGQFRSGCSDIAERHDDYLAEVYGELTLVSAESAT